VLRGPSTLFFGSGAIGGVVNIVDKRVPTDTETRAEWMLSHSSVNDQDQASFNLNTGTGNIALHADGFWRESNDYDVPTSPEIDEDHGERSVASTGEDSEGFTVGASYLLDNGHVGFSYGRLDRDYGVPGHGHGEEEHDDDDDHEEEEEVVTLGMKQNRYQMISELSLDHDFFSDFKARIGHTDYEHTEFENGATGTTFSNETTEVKLELLHKPLYGWNGGLVFDYKDTDFSAKGEEAFAPPSESKTFAIAAVEERHFGDVLVQLGARIEHINIKSNDIEIPEVEFHHHDDDDAGGAHDDDDHDEESFSFDEDYTPFSLSVGAVWEFKPGYNVGVSFSHAERAPSAAELLSYGPHIATGTF
ncbi:MAG: TonB-dependent receptor, partial [Pseudomonadota bacterium]|nr:TonB-dependent receptor [Pseudomonadota bacterium]